LEFQAGEALALAADPIEIAFLIEGARIAFASGEAAARNPITSPSSDFYKWATRRTSKAASLAWSWRWRNA
jgi:hypothetical protein